MARGPFGYLEIYPQGHRTASVGVLLNPELSFSPSSIDSLRKLIFKEVARRNET